jgi:uncharacterized membrane protein
MVGQAGGLSGALTQFADPWSKIYSHSKAVSAAVIFFHLVPLVIAGGSAFAADRATLRAAKAGIGERARQLEELAGIHRIVVFGLTLSFITGILLFLSDVETFLGSIFLWIKLGFVGLLLLNGYALVHTERALARAGAEESASSPLWGRLRMFSVLSAVLWLATVLAGVVLTQFA